MTGTLLRDSKEETAYLEVSDTEIELWDSAADGALLGTAKYPQALPGAEAALQSCDWTDLDEDGNSELTAEFSFSDGTLYPCLLYTSPSPRDRTRSRMPSSA